MSELGRLCHICDASSTPVKLLKEFLRKLSITDQCVGGYSENFCICYTPDNSKTLTLHSIMQNFTALYAVSITLIFCYRHIEQFSSRYLHSLVLLFLEESLAARGCINQRKDLLRECTKSSRILGFLFE